MQESKEQQKIYSFIQIFIYFTCILDFFIVFGKQIGNSFLDNFLTPINRIPVFEIPLYTKFFLLLMIIIVAIGTKAKKELNINKVYQIGLPVVIGLVFLFGSLYVLNLNSLDDEKNVFLSFNLTEIAYLVLTVLGAFLTMVGLDNISKLIKYNSKDRFNTEQESFDQETQLKYTDTSINIPMLFFKKGKWVDGWININPFRGTIVIGTPGSGKSYGVINPTIRQMIDKNFALCLYDFKYPDLAKIAYYNYLLKKKKDKTYKHSFNVININDIKKSVRVNPLAKEYIGTLAEASDIAESIVYALQKGGSGGSGSDAFFTNSAINFLASCIYFFSQYEYEFVDEKTGEILKEKGKLSTLPHILAFMNQGYDVIFSTLFTNPELKSLLSPFKSAFDNKAFEQLEGQIGTIKIFMSKLATKESFWVFSSNDVNLKISDAEDPSIIILASDPNTQDINSAFYAVVLNRLLRLVNSKGNLPVGVIADEVPTLYIHKIDNVIATARSNKVAVMLGLQEIPQFKQFYKKEIADTIVSIVGNILSGSARNKETLDWLEKVFGKIKQKSVNLSLPSSGATISYNERMDNLIPAGKIASLQTGEMVGVIAKDREDTPSAIYTSSAVNCRVNLSKKQVETEEANYRPIPDHYSFQNKKGEDITQMVLDRNFNKIYKDVDTLIEQCTNEVSNT